jgi:RNA polymerase sigma-70 factor, ECF subfamily
MRRQSGRAHGNQDFEHLVLPLLDALYRAARTLTGDVDAAAELVQTACVKALDRFETFVPGTHGKAWMMKIMRNAWIDQIRHRQVAGPEIPLDEERLEAAPVIETGETDFVQILERFSDERVIDALMELKEPQRMALFLNDVEGLSQEEVAEVLNVAVGTVKSRVSRARAILRDKLENHAREMGYLERRPCRT